jgi:hypothetical protein
VIAATNRIQPERTPAEGHHHRCEMDETAGYECLIHCSASRLDLEIEGTLGGMRIHRDDVPRRPVSTGTESRHRQDKQGHVCGEDRYRHICLSIVVLLVKERREDWRGKESETAE